MEIVEYKNMYQNERDHYFYVATHALVLTLLSHFFPNRKQKLNILDAGCGTGLLAKKMAKFGRVQGIDMSSEALRFAKKRRVDVKKASIEKIPFKKNTFDAVVSIDVLTSSSIKDDLVPLREFYRVLKPGGILILRVSAYPWLKLIHDKHVHMNHRYEKDELKRKLKKADLKLEKISFIHSIFFPLIVLRHFWENLIKPKQTKSAVGKTNPLINNLLIKLLLIEVYLFMKINLPFGLGLVSVSRKN
jgi:SAM-dependent methyltransferase